MLFSRCSRNSKVQVENVQEKDELREEYPLNKFVYVDWPHHGLSIQEFSAGYYIDSDSMGPTERSRVRSLFEM